MHSCLANVECLSSTVTLDIVLSLTGSKRWFVNPSVLGVELFHLRLPLPLCAAVEGRQRGNPKREISYRNSCRSLISAVVREGKMEHKGDDWRGASPSLWCIGWPYFKHYKLRNPVLTAHTGFKCWFWKLGAGIGLVIVAELIFVIVQGEIFQTLAIQEHFCCSYGKNRGYHVTHH